MRIQALTAALLAPLAAHAQTATITLSATYAQLVPGQAQAFSASVSGGGDTSVTWQVDNINGGSAVVGTITQDGVLTAPQTLPSPASLTVTAVSVADPSVSATATVTLVAQAASGRVYYVAPGGQDSAPGTLAAPFQTIGHAAEIAVAGDTVLVRQGVYRELVTPPHSGTAQGYITFSAYPGETASVDGTGLAIPGGQNGLFTLTNLSYVVVQGFELRNYSTTSVKAVPVGLFVQGAGSNVQVINNHIHDIATTAATTPQACSSNALGLAVYGSRAPAAITGLVISGNELDHLTTGCSETMSIDGNVAGFAVTSNLVHDDNNIGIDAIGYERVSPNPAYDFARNGEIRGNTVRNITSYGNPDYGKQYASDGIYVDGGANIVIEQNTVHDTDYGIELASEHKGRLTSQVIARNNLVYANNSSGVTIGGYGAARGGTDHCTIIGNTLLGNDTKSTGSGEFQIQFNATNDVFENNIVQAGQQGLLVNGYTKAVTSAPTVLDHNVYFSPLGATRSRFRLGGHSYTGFAKYQAGSGQDAHSVFADPLLQSATAPVMLEVRPGSPAFGLGANPGAAVTGAADAAGQPRVQDGGVTAGAYAQ